MIRSHHVFGITALITTILNLYTFHSHYFSEISNVAQMLNDHEQHVQQQQQQQQQPPLSHIQLQDPFLFMETILDEKETNKKRDLPMPSVSPGNAGNIQQQQQKEEEEEKPTLLCKSFFSVMSAAFLPFEQRDALPCNKLYAGRYKPLLERHSKQMVKLNTTLTVFTSWSDMQKRTMPECQPLNSSPDNNTYYPNIIERDLGDPYELLQYYNFSQQQQYWISQVWHNYSEAVRYRPIYEHKKNVGARLADLFRILLAHRHQMAYLDLDMIPLLTATSTTTTTKQESFKNLFLATPNVAVPLWGDENGGLEIQNSGYCFTQKQLEYLIDRAKLIIDSTGPNQDYRRYTALGPTLFHRSIQTLTALAPTRLLFTTSNDDSSPTKVLRKILQQYPTTDFHWLHLDGRFRGSNSGKGLDQLRGALDTVFTGIETRTMPTTNKQQQNVTTTKRRRRR